MGPRVGWANKVCHFAPLCAIARKSGRRPRPASARRFGRPSFDGLRTGFNRHGRGREALGGGADVAGGRPPDREQGVRGTTTREPLNKSLVPSAVPRERVGSPNPFVGTPSRGSKQAFDRLTANDLGRDAETELGEPQVGWARRGAALRGVQTFPSSACRRRSGHPRCCA